MTEKPDARAEKHSLATSLPAKLTGIVFWGMVLVGILVATYLLNEREHRLESAYSGAESYIEYELERLYEEQAARIYDHDYMSQQITELYRAVSANYPIQALSLVFAGHHYEAGKTPAQDAQITGAFSIRE